MGTLARACPYCGALCAADEVRCHRCRRTLRAPWVYNLSSWGRGLLGERAPLTSVFFLICALQFTLMTLVAGFSLSGAMLASEQLRWGALFIDPTGSLVGREPWRYLSAAFFHFGALHIVFNMMTLGGLGAALEPKLGSARFAVLYVLAGAMSFVVSDHWHRLSGVPSATGGASGALFGLMGASAALKAVRREAGWKQSLMGLAVLMLIMTFLVPASMIQLDNSAHLGGLLTGLALGYLFGWERRQRKLARVFQVGATIGVLASVASLVACQISPEWRVQRELELQWGLERGNR